VGKRRDGMASVTIVGDDMKGRYDMMIKILLMKILARCWIL
jgi:hypothetical protein